MYCRNCGEQISDGASVCVKCGFNVRQGTSFCSHCGSNTVQGQSICTQCGFALNNSAQSGFGQASASGQILRTRQYKVFGGLCAGLEKYKGINRYVTRVLFVLFGATFIGLVGYIVACCVIPMEQ